MLSSDPQAQEGALVTSSTPYACPCCQFRLPEGLFLPSDSRGGGGGGAHEGRRQEQEGAGPPPLRSDMNSGADSHEPALRDLLSPREAYKILVDRLREHEESDGGRADSSAFPLVLVDTHCHAHLEREANERTYYALTDEQQRSERKEPESEGGTAIAASSSDRRPLSIRRPRPITISIGCAVAPSDWDACLAHAASLSSRIPALGVHPWYLEEIIPPGGGDGDGGDSIPADRLVLCGEANSSSLPSQSSPRRSLAPTLAAGDWLRRLKSLLLEHPGCLVGEIGLCKQAKFLRTYPGGKAEAMALQREAFRAQLLLACQLGRAASVHCVNQHGALLDTLRSIVHELLDNRRHHETAVTGADPSWASATRAADPGSSPALFLPPAIALHSFTGTAHQVRQLLAWEADLPPRIRVRGQHPSKSPGEFSSPTTGPPPLPPLLYFGFSHAVNVAMCSSDKARRQGRDAVREVPMDRLLAESDVSNSRDVSGGTMGAVAYLAATVAASTTKATPASAAAVDSRNVGARELEVPGPTTFSGDEGGGKPTADDLLRMVTLTSENGIRFLQHQ